MFFYINRTSAQLNQGVLDIKIVYELHSHESVLCNEFYTCIVIGF